MKSSSIGHSVRALTIALGLGLALSFGVTAAAADRAPGRAAATPPASVTAPAATGTQMTGLVGADTCLTCHEQQKGFEKTLHGKAQNVRTPAAAQGCETCHGPGQKHVDSGKKEDIKRFTVLAARDVNQTCLSCHSRGAHSQWQGSMHDARNLSCTTCHSIHSPRSEKAQLKTVSATETCAACHRQEAMKVQKSSHMPVREGKMECTSCHNPHGATNVRMLKAGNWINESCTSCHTEKRGPFLWEHSAGRENCASCHDPHGSSNDRMLVAKAPMLCQRCHVSSRHPATIYDGAQVTAASNRVVGRACVNCHSQIHGSNSPAGNRFLR